MSLLTRMSASHVGAAHPGWPLRAHSCLLSPCSWRQRSAAVYVEHRPRRTGRAAQADASLRPTRQPSSSDVPRAGPATTSDSPPIRITQVLADPERCSLTFGASRAPTGATSTSSGPTAASPAPRESSPATPGTRAMRGTGWGAGGRTPVWSPRVSIGATGAGGRHHQRRSPGGRDRRRLRRPHRLSAPRLGALSAAATGSSSSSRAATAGR